MTDELATLVCPRCGCSDVIFKEVAFDGTVTAACSACPQLWPIPPASPDAIADLVRLGDQLATFRTRAQVRRELGQINTAVRWEGKATAAALELRDLLEGVAA